MYELFAIKKKQKLNKSSARTKSPLVSVPITLGGKTIQLENSNNLDEIFYFLLHSLNSAMELERVGSKGDSSPMYGTT